MPINIRSSSVKDWIKEWACRLIRLYAWLKLCSRQNPGFAAAAAAGTIGLVLAIGPLMDAGRTWLYGTDEALNAEVDAEAATLGEPVGFAPAHSDETTNDPFAEPMVATGRASSRQQQQEAEEMADELEEAAEIVSRMTPIRKRVILDVDEDETGEEAADQSPAPADETPKGPAMLPVEVADDEASEELGDETAEDAGTQSLPLQPKKLQSEIETVGATEVQPDAEEELPGSRGWKLPPPKPGSQAAPSIASARQSRPAETVIIATPPRKPAARSAASSGPISDARRLGLEISGPKSASLEQTCAYEIRVKNTGSAPARQLTLTVNLPEGLDHELAPVLVQRIDAIAPGQTYRALLRVRTSAHGKLTFQARVAKPDGSDVQSAATVDVHSATGRTARTVTPSDCCPTTR